MSLTNHGEDKLLTLFKDAGPYWFGLFTVAPKRREAVRKSAAGPMPASR